MPSPGEAGAAAPPPWQPDPTSTPDPAAMAGLETSYLCVMDIMSGANLLSRCVRISAQNYFCQADAADLKLQLTILRF